MMKAIHVQSTRSGPQLLWGDAPDVDYGPGEVLVDIRATAVNRADLSQARGHYPAPPGASQILGLEMAGVIRAIGDDVNGWQAGDRVCALLPGGGYAQQAAVPAEMLLRLPDAWDFTQGAAVPEVWFTAYVNLFLEGKLQAGETALIHAGASGVGTAAIQLVRHIGAIAYVTAGAEAKLERCRQLGAQLAINYKEQDFLKEVMQTSDNAGVDLILDPVGGSYLERNISALKPFGRLVNIGLLGGMTGELNMAQLLRKRLHIVGSTLRTRPLSEKIDITRGFEQSFWPFLVDGQLQTVIDSVYPIQEAQKAHDYVLADRNTGKVIMSVS